jgi:hypothetical protein
VSKDYLESTMGWFSDNWKLWADHDELIYRVEYQPTVFLRIWKGIEYEDHDPMMLLKAS